MSPVVTCCPLPEIITVHIICGGWANDGISPPVECNIFKLAKTFGSYFLGLIKLLESPWFDDEMLAFNNDRIKSAFLCVQIVAVTGNSSILCCLSGSGLWWQQIKQGITSFSSSWGPQGVLDQMEYLITPVCSGSALGISSQLDILVPTFSFSKSAHDQLLMGIINWFHPSISSQNCG